jgi:hypothetical protein
MKIGLWIRGEFVARRKFGERFKVLLIGAICFPSILAG